jgi:hypothetical protein
MVIKLLSYGGNMLRFDYDCGKAQIWDDVGSEDGWCLQYDDGDKTFLLWSNSEHEAMGHAPEFICANLDEVLSLVKTFT